MAETKQAKKTKSRKSSGASKSSSSKSKASGSANGAAAKGSKAASAASSNGHGVAESIAPVVQKAKLPLLATGAAIAGGAAAVIAAKNGGHQRKVLGVKVPKRSKSHLPSVSLPKPKLPKGKGGIKSDVRKAAGAVSDAAKQADEIGKRISKVANSVQTVSETTDDAAKKS